VVEEEKHLVGLYTPHKYPRGFFKALQSISLIRFVVVGAFGAR
jgi:hypothetical protein